jgi:hypothetical protein
METLQSKSLLVAIAVILLTICYPLLLRLYFWLGGGGRRRNSPQEGSSSRHSRSTTFISMEQAYFTRRHVPGVDATFSLFVNLGDDLMTHILSFVAEAPFEQANNNNNSETSFMAALTHSLPLVSKQFHRLCQTDDLWKAAIVRQVAREEEETETSSSSSSGAGGGGGGGLWNAGLKSLLLLATANNATNISNNNAAATTAKGVAQTLDQICNASETTCAEIYKTILNSSIRFTGPIFCMPQRFQLGVPYGLHFFEPRYRRLIADIMAPFPETARQGGPILCSSSRSREQQQGGGNEQRQLPAPPVFIHAHAHGRRLERGTPACLVQVIRCHVYPDGRADVFLMPTGHVRTELLWQVPHTGHLHCGQFMRLAPGSAASQQADREAAGRVPL